MGFFLQLRLLLWKNFIMRKRHKIRCVLEIIWPLILFLILAWVRMRGLKEDRQECHYIEKPMPSSGQLAFLHSFICNAVNKCHHKEPSPDYADHTGNATRRFAEAVQAVGDLLQRQGRARRVSSNVQDVAQLLASVARNPSSPVENPSAPADAVEDLSLRELLGEDAAVGLTENQLETRLSLAELDTIISQEDPRAAFCNELSDNASEAVCSFPDSVWENFQTQGELYRRGNLQGRLRGWQWLRLNALLRTVALDLDQVSDSRLSPSLTAVLSQIARLGRRQPGPLADGATRSAIPLEGWCDTLDGYNEQPREDENDFTRAMRGERPQIKAHYKADPDEPKECGMLYNSSSPSATLIWRVVKPFVTGKILFTPNTPATREIMAHVNKTFNELLSLPGYDVLREPPEDTLRNAAVIQEFLRSEDGGAVARASLASNGDLLARLAQPRPLVQDLTAVRGEDGEDVDWIGVVSETIKFFWTVSKCLNRNKVVAVESPENAEAEAIKLVLTNNLWALVVFDHVGNETLETFVKYRIRMSADRTDVTYDLTDRRTNLRGRDSPVMDMKYMTYGFAYLQDMIDSAILQKHTGRTGRNIPGRTLQQFPYPKYIYDTFIKAISNTFPMFMVLAWVYTSSMLVKSIVYEKEQRIKETLSVMGLSNAVHWAGWFIDSFVCMLISTCMLSAILVYGEVLGNSSYSVAFVFLLSFCVATISKSFLISAFFSRANVAAAAGGIIYFMMYMPYPLVVRFIDVIPYEGIIGLSLVSNIAFGLGAAVFASYEQLGEGVHWSNIDKPASPEDLYSLGTCVRMLWLDALIYAVFTWYIETVWPGEYGIPKPFYFFLQKSYWCGSGIPPEANSNGVTPSRNVAANNMEPEPNGIVGVSVEGLSKIFRGKAAVSDLYLNFYQDQITCFLGHNGAGKTTTISMLTGMYPPTRGTARIYGMDIRTQMDRIRSSMGVCPQHNVLYDRMTVAEHLWFFGRIKGQPKEPLLTEIDRMLADMELTDKRDAPTTSLSGGMKRKVSVAMAFIGGSRTVFLDEPTAGVDPYSRRAIWELLIKYRAGRTVILTTHFMDEADLLGDRIALISSGKLYCCGSSLFLKGRFGSGYYLTVEWGQFAADDVESKQRMTALRSLVSSNVPSAQLVQELGLEVEFVLPDRHDVESITKVLTALEDQRESLGINSFGISDTTLEEIFLKVAENNDHQGNGNSSVAVEQSPPENHPDKPLTGWSLMGQQFWALCYRRLQYTRRDLKGMFTQLVLPALFVTACLAFTSFFHLVTNQPELELEASLYPSPHVAFMENRPEVPHNLWTSRYLDAIFTGGLGSALVPERNDIPHPELSTRMKNAKRGGYSNVNCDLDYTPSDNIPSGEKVYNTTGLDVPQWILDSVPVCRKNRYGGMSFGAVYPWTAGVNLNLSTFDPKEDTVRIWYNNKGHISSVAYQNAVNNLLLRASLPEDKQNDSEHYGILTSNHPLPLNAYQQKDKTMNEAGVVLLHAVAVIFAMSFVPASFVMFLIDDRVTQSKHLQLVSGLRRSVYWVQSYIWDMMCFSVSAVLVVVIFYAFDTEMYTTGDNLLGLTLLILFYGWASIPLLYILSWAFRVASMAFVALACGNLFIGLVTTLTVLVLGLFRDSDLTYIRGILEEVFLVFPQYCLGQGVMNLAMNYANEVLYRKQGLFIQNNIFSWAITGKHLVCLLATGAISFIFVFVVEYGLIRFSRTVIPEPGDLAGKEEDVEQERRRVTEGNVRNDILVLDHLTKAYRSNAPLAVNQVTFGVHRGECFGLLGLNGAGKTSIFKMLTGDIAISSGDSRVSGLSVRSDMDGVRQQIGYCPQFDALVPLLTVREHLEFYSRIRGIPPANIQSAVQSVIQKLNLGFHQDKRAKTLSGGNKRKLSTGIALLGDPPLLYMDEPTTSMDPAARRFLWDCIQTVVAEGRAVVLTSHSMEECQALCTRLTIMVNGELTCIGSPQHLKSKYGSGYSAVVRCVTGREEDTRKMVSQSIVGSVVVEAHVNQIKYHVPQDAQGARLVDIFRAMNQARIDGLILDYSITQTTLEDVFMRFAQEQSSDEAPSTGPRLRRGAEVANGV